MLKQLGFKVEAWHVDHSWRPESAMEDQVLAQKADVWGIPYFSVRLEQETQRNREAVARSGRFAAFAQLARKRGLKDICLAHHRQDQAETVCMRMLQGAGVAGCRGIRAVRHEQGLCLYRPLLTASKQELQDLLENHDIHWLSDPSNADESLMRNRVRLSLFPSMQRAGVEPEGLFVRWGVQASRIYGALAQLSDQVEIMSMKKGCYVDWISWREQMQPVRALVLQNMAARLHGEGVVMGRRHIELVDQWIAHSGRGSVDLSGCRLRREGANLHLEVAEAV